MGILGALPSTCGFCIREDVKCLASIEVIFRSLTRSILAVNHSAFFFVLQYFTFQACAIYLLT